MLLTPEQVEVLHEDRADSPGWAYVRVSLGDGMQAIGYIRSEYVGSTTRLPVSPAKVSRQPVLVSKSPEIVNPYHQHERRANAPPRLITFKTLLLAAAFIPTPDITISALASLRLCVWGVNVTRKYIDPIRGHSMASLTHLPSKVCVGHCRGHKTHENGRGIIVTCPLTAALFNVMPLLAALPFSAAHSAKVRKVFGVKG